MYFATRKLSPIKNSAGNSITEVADFSLRLLTALLLMDLSWRRFVRWTKTENASETHLHGRLLQRQEEERQRIAREIHDNYNQRLATVAINLEELSDSLSESCSEVKQKLHEMFNCVSELGADMHILSHTLHSSTLDNLGLVPGIKAFCAEFTEQQELRVDFSHDGVQIATSQDQALCFFRVVQEALKNVKIHSGADRAEVRLESAGGKLYLQVIDRGKGFDAQSHFARRGIGIRSMQERLRLLGGELKVYSKPRWGTRIDAWAPIQSAPNEQKLFRLRPMSSM